MPFLTRLFLISSILLLNLPSSAFAGEKWQDVKSWVYQLTDYTDDKLDEIADAPFDLAVIDLARDGSDDYFTKSEIKMVKSNGKIVLAYFEIGAIEDYRPEWDSVPADLKAGEVDGWPKEQYVKFWDQRWWTVIQGRIDQAIAAGFDGAYLDLITAYEEIPHNGTSSEDMAQRMVSLIDKISRYAKKKQAGFKIVPQNCPELYTWSYWSGKPNLKYLNAIDGLGLESVFFIAHDKPSKADWCIENRNNAIALQKAGKLILAVDYAKKTKNIISSYQQLQAIKFIPYVSVRDLDRVCKPPTK
ncbi:MAG: endo alpha-1,4 polygalactosaminidase [Verrucomicrobiales bacterium]|nr:endo alpha-1,4 polygalactosaminidase [Verrucomicrobiales bacterium]